MADVITTCSQCSSRFAWNTDYQEKPSCPNCGFNPVADVKSAARSGEIDELVHLLRSGSSEPRSQAAVELGKLGDVRAVPALIEALDDDEVELAAVIALGRLRDERAVEPLARVMLKPRQQEWPKRDTFYGWGAPAEALARIGTPNAVTTLLEAMKTHRLDGDALNILADRNDSVGIDAALWVLRECDPWFRGRAVRALARTNWRPKDLAQNVWFLLEAREFEELAKLPQRESVVQLLRGDLTKRLEEDTWRALQALDWTPENDTEALIHSAFDAIWSEVISKGSKAVPVFEKFIENRTMPYGGWRALGEIGTDDSIRLLAGALADQYVYATAKEVLAGKGRDKVVEILLEVVRDKSNPKFQRTNARDVLRTIGRITGRRVKVGRLF